MARWLLGAASFLVWVAAAAAEVPLHSKDVLSPVYTIDRRWVSMQGPRSTQPVALREAPVPELLWITGFRARMVAQDGVSPMPEEFFCHINLDLDRQIHGSIFPGQRATPRVLTLSQGQTALDFPKGFGIPVMSHEPLTVTTQVLNHNFEKPDVRVRHRVTIDFVRDAELAAPLVPLITVRGFGLVLLKGRDGHPGMEHGDASVHGESCLPGDRAPNAWWKVDFKDEFDREFSGHWVVPPGRDVRHTNVTKLLQIPFDTTLHYVAVHLHPFARSLELRDLTAGRTIFTSHATAPERGIGLRRVETFSSAEGIPVFRDHQYQIVSVYENTTSVPQDAMAAVFLLLKDAAFRHPSAPARDCPPEPAATAALSP